MKRWLQWFSPLVLIGLWQLLGGLGMLGATPLPREVIAALWGLIQAGDPFLRGALWAHVTVSLWRILGGFAIAVLAGTGLGLVMGWYPWIRAIMRPLVEMLRPVPPFAWVVLAILWFKTGSAPAIFITFLGAFFPITVNTSEGVAGVSPLLREAAATLGASRWSSLRMVAVPAAAPQIFTGLRVGLGVAWMSLIAAEMAGVGTRGLGLLIETSKAVWRLDYAVAGMVVIGLVGFFLDFLMRLLGDYLLRWR